MHYAEKCHQNNHSTYEQSYSDEELLSYLVNNTEKIREFGVLNLDSVLEHVPNPILLLETLKHSKSRETVLRIEVPNDFSQFQDLLLKEGVTDKTWIAPPAHLSYFNITSLKSVIRSVGFTVFPQADFPIELFFLNEHSNYAKDKRLGRAAHTSRVKVTNYLSGTNLTDLLILKLL